MQCSRPAALLLALAAALQAASGVPLSDWHDGIATNYGGAQDGMNPYDPSFGTKEVGTLGLLTALCSLKAALRKSDVQALLNYLAARRDVSLQSCTKRCAHQVLWQCNTGGMRVWDAAKGLVPILECGGALAEQFLLGGRAGQGVRGVL